MTIPTLTPLERKLINALASSLIVLDDAPKCRATIKALCTGQAVLADIYGYHDRPWDVDFLLIREMTKEEV